jgi:hypothetical protein
MSSSVNEENLQKVVLRAEGLLNTPNMALEKLVQEAIDARSKAVDISPNLSKQEYRRVIIRLHGVFSKLLNKYVEQVGSHSVGPMLQVMIPMLTQICNALSLEAVHLSS